MRPCGTKAAREATAAAAAKRKAAAAKRKAAAGGELAPTKGRKTVGEEKGCCSEETAASCTEAGSVVVTAGSAGEMIPIAAPAEPMSAIDYLVAHKRLPQCEIDFVLMEKRTRKPFADTLEFKCLTADPSTTPEELAAAAAEHEAQQERSIKFQEFVLEQYVAHGEVVVDDAYIARRVETEEFSKQLWEKAFAGMDLSDFADTTDDEDDEFIIPLVTREEAKKKFGL